MINRLEDLGLYGPDNDDLCVDEVEMIEITKKKKMGNDDSNFIEEFKCEVDRIKESIEEGRKMTEDLYHGYLKKLSVVKNIGEGNMEMRNSNNDLNMKRKNLSTHLAKIKDDLKEIDKETEFIKRKNNGDDKTDKKSAEVRLRTNMYYTLLKDFSKCVSRFQEVELEYKRKKRIEIRRKLEIVSDDEGEVTENMVDRFLKDKKSIFFEKLKGTAQWKTAKNEIKVAMETRDDLLELETNMNELCEMFTDMYALVNMQQDLIDSIEQNIQEASHYVDKGRKNFVKAKNDSKRGKICTLLLLIVMMVVLIIVLVVITVGLGGGIAALVVLVRVFL